MTGDLVTRLEIEETGMTMNVTEIIRKTMGWCPDAAILNKKEEIYMVSYGGKSITNIRSMGGSRDAIPIPHARVEGKFSLPPCGRRRSLFSSLQPA